MILKSKEEGLVFDKNFIMNNWPNSLLSAPIVHNGSGNTKLSKRRKGEENWHIYSLSLSPADSSGLNVCEFSSAECRKHCVGYAGYGMLRSVQNKRIIKTLAFNYNPLKFTTQLCEELRRLEEMLKRNPSRKIAIRLNTFSDIDWQNYIIFNEWPHLQFYDYTKDMLKLPLSNYDLTYSIDPTKDKNDVSLLLALLKLGRKIAIVFDNKIELPEKFHGYPIINGDESDLRFLDPSPSIIALRAKGSLKKDDLSTFKVSFLDDKYFF